MKNIGETYVNYTLCKDVKKAYQDEVFEDFGIDSDEEDRHISELERRMAALDEKETYVTTKTLVKHHFETFKRTLAHMQKEGELNETD